MIEINGQLESRSGCLFGPAGISGPELDPGQPYEANCLRILGVQRQMLVAMGHAIGFNGTISWWRAMARSPRQNALTPRRYRPSVLAIGS